MITSLKSKWTTPAKSRSSELLALARLYFSSSKSMTTGVFAWMLCLRPLGMWTQVPGLAYTVSSPSVSFPSPWRKCRTAGIERGNFRALSSSSSPHARLQPETPWLSGCQPGLKG
jgi:hypothetical protein